MAIHIPTLGEICDYGEAKYFSMIKLFTSTPSDLMWQLDEAGIDFTTLSDWDLFYQMLYTQFTPMTTKIIFGDFDFSALEQYRNKTTNDLSLKASTSTGLVTIDYYTYLVMTEIIRKIHGFKKNERKPANQTTKRILIEDAREEYLMSKNKEYHSYLKNLVSTMVNSEGFKFNYLNVWDMNIYAFLDSVKRIAKIKNASLLLQSGYSGFGIDLNKLNSNQLDWLGEL